MKFKYSEKINILGIINCPPNECSVVEDAEICYRWVHGNIEHKNNFIPVLEISPKRVDAPSFGENTQKCSGFALSMYDSFENSFNEYQRILSKNKNFSQIVGTHIAKLSLFSGDGYRNQPSQNGHFDLFELENINWIKRIIDISEIK